MHKKLLTLAGVLGLASALFISCSDESRVGDPTASTGVVSQPRTIHPMNQDAGGISGDDGFAGKALSSHTAIIDNGVVQLGVHDEGHLNVPGGTLSNNGTTVVGLRYLPTNGEATAPGCLCEGWGAGDGATSVRGWASVHTGGVVNLSVESFTATASEAVSTVLVDGILRVTQDYHPSPDTPNLYEVDVTLENISASAIADLRYTRGMDWDIPPTTFNEYVTIQGTAAATDVLLAVDNGFNTVDPLGFHSPILATGDFVDSGPADHGAHFDFGFGALGAGESKSFRIFYGAAADEADALAALAAVGAEVYSFGQQAGDPVGGTPNTFIFAFAGVGGTPLGGIPIDIKPGSCPNPFELGSNGVLPVAILGTESLDVTEIDPATVTLAGVPALRSSLEDVSTPVTDDNREGEGCEDCTTAGADGALDLTLKFDRQAIAAAILAMDPVPADRDCVELELVATKLESGDEVTGSDVIRVQSKSKGKKK